MAGVIAEAADQENTDRTEGSSTSSTDGESLLSIAAGGVFTRSSLTVVREKIAKPFLDGVAPFQPLSTQRERAVSIVPAVLQSCLFGP